MSYRYTLDKTRLQNCKLRTTINYQSALNSPSKDELREELAQAARNTAALPLHSDGLPHDAGEGEAQ